MNYLSLILLCFITLSCDNYNPFDNKSSEEAETFYWEIDFHQQALNVEDFHLRKELRAIEEEQENGNYESQVRMEEIQIRLAEIDEDLVLNNQLLEAFRGGIPGGGFPPSCEPEREFRPCPMPRLAVNNLFINVKQFSSEESGFNFLDRNGETVGQMVDQQMVPETEGQFSRAIMEYDVERAVTVSVSKVNSSGEIRTTEYILE